MNWDRVHRRWRITSDIPSVTAAFVSQGSVAGEGLLLEPGSQILQG